MNDVSAGGSCSGNGSSDPGITPFTVEQARTTQTQSFYTDFDALVSDVRDTYKDLQEDLEGLQTEFKEDVEQLAALVSMSKR